MIKATEIVFVTIASSLVLLVIVMTVVSFQLHKAVNYLKTLLHKRKSHE